MNWTRVRKTYTGSNGVLIVKTRKTASVSARSTGSDGVHIVTTAERANPRNVRNRYTGEEGVNIVYKGSSCVKNRNAGLSGVVIVHILSHHLGVTLGDGTGGGEAGGRGGDPVGARVTGLTGVRFFRNDEYRRYARRLLVRVEPGPPGPRWGETRRIFLNRQKAIHRVTTVCSKRVPG